jgi:simple sugar transport system ATP-binding protein
MQSLSGGNQQKALIARELHGHPPVILAINPTRGLDIGATAFVLEQLAAARARGAAILLIHSDLDELLSVSDRVMVMYAGRLLPTPWPAIDRVAIGRMMMGIAPQAA